MYLLSKSESLLSIREIRWIYMYRYILSP